MNAMPRNTTKTPTTEQTKAANDTASNARCIKANSHGSIKASIMLVVRVIDFQSAVSVDVMLVGIGLTVQMHHEQMSAEGVA